MEEETNLVKILGSVETLREVFQKALAKGLGLYMRTDVEDLDHDEKVKIVYVGKDFSILLQRYYWGSQLVSRQVVHPHGSKVTYSFTRESDTEFDE